MSEPKREDLAPFDPITFGRNVRKYRILRGLTQTELAQQLFVAPQSVSKWERGENIPDLARFYGLVRALSISSDALIGACPKESTYIGIDGGGTKTEFVLIDGQGRILNSIILGPSNPNTCGFDAACSLVKQGIDFFCPDEMNVCGIFFGGAGLGVGNHAEALRTQLSKAYPNVKVGCGTDILNVIACGSDPDNCIAAICGTGSVVFVSDNGKLMRAGGGAGYLFDKSGSGYDMGRAAIAAALEARDHTGRQTLLTELVEERLGGNVWSFIHDLYKKDVSYIASFAPLVEQAFIQDDPVARDILEDNSRRLAHLIRVAQEKAPQARSLVLSGSLLCKSNRFFHMLETQLPPGLRVELLTCPPVWGACLQCIRLCAVTTPPSPEQFMSQYKLIGKGASQCSEQN